MGSQASSWIFWCALATLWRLIVTPFSAGSGVGGYAPRVVLADPAASQVHARTRLLGPPWIRQTPKVLVSCISSRKPRSRALNMRQLCLSDRGLSRLIEHGADSREVLLGLLRGLPAPLGRRSDAQ